MPCTESKQDKCRQGNANVTWCGKQRLGTNREMYMEKDEERRYQGTSGLNLRSSSVHLARKQCDQIGLFFKGLGWQIFLPKKPKHLATFWSNIPFCIKTAAITFCAFLKKMGYFLFQNMVTLRAKPTTTSSAQKSKFQRGGIFLNGESLLVSIPHPPPLVYFDGPSKAFSFWISGKSQKFLNAFMEKRSAPRWRLCSRVV